MEKTSSSPHKLLHLAKALAQIILGRPTQESGATVMLLEADIVLERGTPRALEVSLFAPHRLIQTLMVAL